MSLFNYKIWLTTVERHERIYRVYSPLHRVRRNLEEIWIYIIGNVKSNKRIEISGSHRLLSYGKAAVKIFLVEGNLSREKAVSVLE